MKRLGFDTETKDPDIKTLGPGVRRDNAYMVGASFAIEGGPKHYLPWGHENNVDNLPEENCLAYFKDMFKDFDGELVGANLPYDLDWFWEHGITMPKVTRFRDVQVADPLINELQPSYTLDAISKRHGHAGKDEEGLRKAAQLYGVDAKADIWRMPARCVGPYAEIDALEPLLILRKQEVILEADDLMKVWDTECKILPILLRMSRHGVRVNMDRVDAMEAWSKRQEQAAWDEVKRHTGVEIPVGHCMDVTLVAAALRNAGLPVGTTAKTEKDSVTVDILHQHIEHPVAAAIIGARKASVIRTTFIRGLRNHVITKNGESRLHCSFNQIRKTEESTTDDATGEETKGVKFGRLSSSHTNMQNQPAADRKTGDNLLGCRWRSVYEPDQGTTWTSCDLKQQEPKWSFHYGAILEEAGFKGVTGALALCERLNADPSLDTYIPLVELTGQRRSVCKIMWLARAYGQGDGTLCTNLKLPTRQVTYSRKVWKTVAVDSPEGQEAVASGSFTWEGAGEEGQVIIDKFDGEMPFLKACAKIAKNRANERGFVTLLSGRRCHFGPLPGGGYEWTHKAFNRIIQGQAAEQTKEIMVAVDEAGFGDYLALQVHDELDAFLPTDNMGAEMAEVMRTAVPMRVPTVVDVERGPSWGESMSIESIVDGKTVKRQYVWDL